MGKTTPPKGFSSRLCIRMLPTLPGVALAPKTATDCGRNSGSSEECSALMLCPSSVRLRPTGAGDRRQNVRAGHYSNRTIVSIHNNHAMNVGIDHSPRQLRHRCINGDGHGIGRHESSHFLGGQLLDVDDLPIGQNFMRLAAKNVFSFLALQTASVQRQSTQNSLSTVCFPMLELEKARVRALRDPWTGTAVLLDGPTEKVGSREN